MAGGAFPFIERNRGIPRGRVVGCGMGNTDLRWGPGRVKYDERFKDGDRVTVDCPSGEFRYSSRFRRDGGRAWIHCEGELPILVPESWLRPVQPSIGVGDV